MADFCKQCSIENFGEDYGDLAGIATSDFEACGVLCEGCGPLCVVKPNGECISMYCLRKHGAQPVAKVDDAAR